MRNENEKLELPTMLQCEITESWDRCQECLQDAMKCLTRQRINVEELLGMNRFYL